MATLKISQFTSIYINQLSFNPLSNNLNWNSHQRRAYGSGSLKHPLKPEIKLVSRLGRTHHPLTTLVL